MISSRLDTAAPMAASIRTLAAGADGEGRALRDLSEPPLRVAFVMPHLDAGGAERVVLMLLLHLDRRRFSPALILRDRRGAFLDAVPSDVPVHDLGGRPLRRSLPALIKVIRRTRAEVVYSATNAANLAVLAACLMVRPRVPVVISEHAPPTSYLPSAKWRALRLALVRLLYGTASALAAPTEGVAQDARSLLANVPINVLPNPLVDASELLPDAPVPPEMGALDGPVFVGAGRLVEVKGFDLLIRAFARVRERHPDAHLLLLGEGPQRPRLEALVEALDLRAHVRLIGYRPRLADYLCRASAFVLTSHWEGFGNVLVEALAAGAPVISVDCPVGPRAILEDGKVGLLVERRDPDAIAAAMAAMIEEPERRAEYQAHGRVRARDFDVTATVPGFEALFERVASRRVQPINA